MLLKLPIETTFIDSYLNKFRKRLILNKETALWVSNSTVSQSLPDCLSWPLTITTEHSWQISFASMFDRLGRYDEWYCQCNEIGTVYVSSSPIRISFYPLIQRLTIRPRQAIDIRRSGLLVCEIVRDQRHKLHDALFYRGSCHRTPKFVASMGEF